MSSNKDPGIKKSTSAIPRSSRPKPTSPRPRPRGPKPTQTSLPDANSKPKPTLGPSAVKIASKTVGSRLGWSRHRPRPNPDAVKSKVEGSPCDTRPRSRPTSATTDDRPTGVKLLEWAKVMKFMPHGKFTKSSDYPSTDDMNKLCRGNTKLMWEHLMKCVRPREEVAEIRRALMERRRRDNGDGVEHEGDLALRKEALERQLIEKKIEAKQKEESLAKMTNCLEHKSYIIETIEHQIDQKTFKANLLEMKTDDIKKRTSLTEDYIDATRSLLAGLQHGSSRAGQVSTRGHSINSGTHARVNATSVSRLRECLAQVGEVYDKNFPPSALSHADRLRLLQFTQERTYNLSVHEIWTAMLLLQDELCARVLEIKNETLKQEEENTELGFADADVLIRRLEALCIRLVADTAETERDHEKIASQTDEMYQEVWGLFKERLNTSACLNQTSSLEPSLAEEWLEYSCRCVRMEASTREMKHKLHEMLTQTEHIERGNQNYEELVKEVEQNRDRMASTDQRITYNITLFENIMESVLEMRREICDTLADPALSRDFHKSERLISEMTGVAAEEIKEFASFPLDAIDYVELPSGDKMLRSNLLINYVQGLPLLEKDFAVSDIFSSLDGAPTSTIDEIVFKLHEKRVYANQLRWALEDHKELKTISLYDVAKFRKAENELSDETWLLLNSLKYETQECEAAIKSFSDSYQIYLNHPIQNAIQDDVTEGNLTFTQWKQKYEEVYKRLTEFKNTLFEKD